MKNNSLKKWVVIMLLLLAVVFLFVLKASSDKAYEERVQSETSKELDVYKMHKYADENSEKAMQALQDMDANELEKLVIGEDTANEILIFADWGDMDLDKIKSFGIGSLSPKADENGRIDVGEQLAIKIGGKRYALYIQTLTSRYGKANDGISCIAVTTAKHFKDSDYTWEWQTDDKTLRIGKPFN